MPPQRKTCVLAVTGSIFAVVVFNAVNSSTGEKGEDALPRLGIAGTGPKYGFGTLSGERISVQVRGLQNAGNTCFINVVLQSLASVPPFVQYLQVQVHSPPSAYYQRPFTSELLKMMTDLRPERPPLRPLNAKKLRSLLADKVERFKGFEQQDAQELFQMLMRLVREEAEARPTAPAVDKSFLIGKHESNGLIDIAEDDAGEGKQNKAMPTAADFLNPSPSNPLCGSLASVTRCAECLQTSIRVEPFVDLSLTLPEARDVSGECHGPGMGPAGMGAMRNSVKLAAVLDDFTHEQLVEGVECFKCGDETPKKVGAFKSMLLARPPETLCLHFPRRHPSPHGLMMKLRQHVDFPLRLDVTRFCCAGGHRVEDVASTQTSSDGIPQFSTKPGGLRPGPESSSHSPATTKAATQMTKASRNSPKPRNGVSHALVGGSVEGAEASVATTTPGTDGGRKRINSLGRLGGSVNGSINGSGGGNAAAKERGVTPEKFAGNEDVEYDLRAVIVHHGGAEGGHYTAFRNLAAPSGGRESAGEEADSLSSMMERITQERLGRGRGKDAWISLSDETVKTVPVSEVLASQAYMLFYGRIPQSSGVGPG